MATRALANNQQMMLDHKKQHTAKWILSLPERTGNVHHLHSSTYSS